MYEVSDDSVPQATRAVGLRTALAVLHNWGVTSEQACHVLSISASTYERSQKGIDGLEPIDADQLERISYILNIHAELRACFSDPDNVYGFPSMVNENGFFAGRRPLDVILKGDITLLKLTLASLRGITDCAGIRHFNGGS